MNLFVLIRSLFTNAFSHLFGSVKSSLEKYLRKCVVMAMAVAAGMGFNVRAEMIKAEDALSRAVTQSKRMRKSPLATKGEYKLAVTLNGKGEPAVYIFEGNNRKLVVSADDAFPALLGYFDSRSGEQTVFNPAFQAWLKDYVNQIDYARRNDPDMAEGRDTPVNGLPGVNEQVEVMCSTKWNQTSPYNLDCPFDTSDGEHTVTGCVATAMAQVMKYHNWPATGQGSLRYSWEGTTHTFDFGQSSFDWNRMCDDYESNPYNTAEAEAVSQLMFAAGIGVETNYGVAASGARVREVARALVNYFGYDRGARYDFRNLYTASEWEDMVRSSLRDCGPVIYSGSSETGGHSFVCDGYDGEGFFHFNWGWGGIDNGYFRLTAADDDSSLLNGYENDQSAVFNVRPAMEGSEAPAVIVAKSGFSIEEDIVELGQPVTAKLRMANYSTERKTFMIGLLMTDAYGSETFLKARMVSLASFFQMEEYQLLLPKTLAEGAYTVRPAIQIDGETRLIPIPLDEQREVPMFVEGDLAGFGIQLYSSKAAQLAAEPSRPLYYTLDGVCLGRDVPTTRGLYIKVTADRTGKKTSKKISVI